MLPPKFRCFVCGEELNDVPDVIEHQEIMREVNDVLVDDIKFKIRMLLTLWVPTKVINFVVDDAIKTQLKLLERVEKGIHGVVPINREWQK